MPQQARVTKLSVDLSNVPDRREGGGRAAKVPEGDYLLKVKDAFFAPVKNGKNAGQQQANWILEIVKPVKHKSAGTIWHRTGIWGEAVWAFRNFVQDLRGGQDLPKKAVNVDLSKYIGTEIGATLVDGQPYGPNNTVKSEISQTFPASKFSEGEESTEDEADETDDEEEIETEDDAEDIDEDEI